MVALLGWIFGVRYVRMAERASQHDSSIVPGIGSVRISISYFKLVDSYIVARKQKTEEQKLSTEFRTKRLEQINMCRYFSVE